LLTINDACYRELLKINDSRGYYCNLMDESQTGFSVLDVKHSFSKAGTWRGFHSQEQPYAQGKFVFVSNGKIFDYVLDHNPLSPTYKKVLKFSLIPNGVGVWIPPGLSHGFFALEDSHVFYLVTHSFWNKESSLYISPFGLDVDILSQIEHISDSDKNGKILL